MIVLNEPLKIDFQTKSKDYCAYLIDREFLESLSKLITEIQFKENRYKITIEKIK